MTDITKRRDQQAKNHVDSLTTELVHSFPFTHIEHTYCKGFDDGQAELQAQVDELSKQLNTVKMLKDLYHKSSIKFELELKKFNRFADFVSNDEEIELKDAKIAAYKQALDLAVTQLAELKEFTASILEDMNHYYDNKCIPTLDEVNQCIIAYNQVEKSLKQINQLLCEK